MKSSKFPGKDLQEKKSIFLPFSLHFRLPHCNKDLHTNFYSVICLEGIFFFHIHNSHLFKNSQTHQLADFHSWMNWFHIFMKFWMNFSLLSFFHKLVRIYRLLIEERKISFSLFLYINKKLKWKLHFISSLTQYFFKIGTHQHQTLSRRDEKLAENCASQRWRWVGSCCIKRARNREMRCERTKKNRFSMNPAGCVEIFVEKKTFFSDSHVMTLSCQSKDITNITETQKNHILLFLFLFVLIIFFNTQHTSSFRLSETDWI